MTTQHPTQLHTLSVPMDQATDGLLLPDGTLWSHACTLGKYNKGEEFALERPAIENFVRVFRTGYPNKVPVDYEHASTSNDPEVRKLRAQGEVPKAGDVKELVGVFSAADFTGDLLATAQRLADKVGRPLDDPQNFGLWARWKPTPKALEKVRAEEVNEMSVTFDDDYPDKVTGKGQGPTILAIALTMMPFLDQMLPVAASRGGRREGDSQHDDRHSDAASRGAGGSPAGSGQMEFTMSKMTMLAATAALVGKPVASEDEGAAELTALSQEVPKLRSLSTDLSKALGVEPDKIVATVTQMSADVAAHKQAAKDAKDAQIAAAVETTLKANEAKLTPLSRKIYARELSRELHEGVALEKTETVLALKDLPATGITTRATGADVDDPNGNDVERRTLSRVDELLANDPEVKELARTKGQSAAYNAAVDKAEAEILAAS